MIELKFRMFGAFRKYERDLVPFVLRAEEPLTVAVAKDRLARRLGEIDEAFGAAGDQLVKDSAIANETRVLSPDTVLTGSCTLSLLPPVCGG